MRHFLKKRVSSLLLALVMVMTLTPAVSAKKSADLTYEVDRGKSVEFSKTSFRSLYREEYSGETPSYVVFTDYDDLDDYGTLSAADSDGKAQTLDESDLDNTYFYYKNADVPDNIDYALGGLTFNAKKSGKTGTLRLEFEVYGEDDADYVSGTMEITVSKSSGSAKGDITYTVKPGKEVVFDANDFEDYFDEYCSGSLRYVEFDTPDSDYTDAGKIYYDYDGSDKKGFTRTKLDDYKFYFSSGSYGDYDLDDLSFLANSDFEGSIEIGFTVYGKSDYESGTLVINADGKSGSSSKKGDITYEVDAGDSVDFDVDDFEKFYDDHCSGSLRYVEFDTPDSDYTSAGKIYYDLEGKDEKGFTRTKLGDYKFYASSDSYGEYDLDDLSFLANTDFEGSIAIDFTVYGKSDSETGTLVITTDEKSSSSSSSKKGDITYTVKAGKEIAFDTDDFEDYFKDNCSGTFKYVQFNKPDDDYTNAGSIYYDYGYKSEKEFSRSKLSNYKFYAGEDCETYGDYDLNDLSFVADDYFDGSIQIKFTVYGGSGTKTSQSESGTLVITDGTTGSNASYYSGSIRYSTTPGTPVQINANDVARYYKNATGSALKYMVLTGVPATGSLYYNYYGTSQYGGGRTQLTATAAAGKVFSYSPAAATEYAMSELTYIPGGSNYCTALSFTAYGATGRAVSGTILISVTTSAVAEIYSVTTKGTSVNFPTSSVYSAVAAATGSGFTSIQLLSLPKAASGAMYIGSTAVNTTTAYSYAEISQLRFIPSSSFTGSVTIPYVALNSKGTAIAAGQISIGVVNSLKKFNDISTSTWCYKYVTELSSNGIISGYSNGTFQEKNTITYGAALKLIMLAAGYGEQAPTVKGSTFSGYLAKAKADGLVTGNPNLSGSITRLQIAQIAAKAMKLSTSNLSNKKPFTDTSDVYVQALNAAGIIEGYFSNGTSTYKPNNTLTRGQVSAIVWRMQNYNK